VPFALFDTSVGRSGLAWAARGLVGVTLPEAHDAIAEARLRARLELVEGASLERAEPPHDVQRVIDRVVALLDGSARDELTDVALDMIAVSPFYQRVYAVTRAIPIGATLTYGEVAERIGSKGGSRAVGQALGRNPFPIVVPCHRVLASGGKSGGFSASGGVTTKWRLLAIEGFQPASSTLDLFAPR
jgi:methylated-DNA-[protein]-cysteine S-methyltransferase